MKKVLLHALLPLLLLLAHGCLIRSLNPWLPETQAVKEPNLTGVWYDEKSDTAAFFAAADHNDYRILIVNDKKETTVYRGRLYRIDRTLLLQFGPEPTHNPAQVPSYLICRLDADPSNLSIYLLDPEEFGKRTASGKLAAQLQGSDKDGFIVSAPTAALTEFLTANLKKPGLFKAKPIYRFQKFNRD